MGKFGNGEQIINIIILRFGCAKKVYKYANSKLHTKHPQRSHITLHDKNAKL